MHTFPGVPYQDWLDGAPYELVMACIDFIDSMGDAGEE